jgi:peptide/nickel transport system permease protein
MAEATLGRVDLRERPAPGRVARGWGFLMTLMRRKPLGFISLMFIVGMLVVAAIPGVFATSRPEQTNVAPRFQSYCLGPQGSFLCPTSRDDGGGLLPRVEEKTGSLSQPLGTDSLGRDVYSRIVYGTRVAVYVGFGSVLLSSFIALVVGVTSGYFGGKFDALVQRLVDAVMALPILVILIALPAMIGGPTFTKLIVILGIVGGAGGSRVIRSAVIGIRNSQYLEAAQVIGAKDARIMLQHVVPNIFGPLMVQATIALGGIILAESALSFLGFGVADPKQPTWGQMLQLGQTVASTHFMQAVWPGLAITMAVFSFNMLGDALRDLLDPRLRGAGGGGFG